MNFTDRIARDAIRAVCRPAMRWAIGPQATWAQRRRRQLITAVIPPAAGVSTIRTTVGRVRTEQCMPATARGDLALLYLHGGAYVLGCARAYRHLTSRLAAAASAPVWVPDYRLAPEHPFPAALDDAVAVYQTLLRSGHERVAVVGDSAGGGLAVALVGEAARLGLPAPVALGLICPWVDLSVDAAARRPRSPREPFITPWLLEAGAGAYAANESRADPRISPLLAEMAALPPVVLDICTDDLIAGDGRRLARAVRSGGGQLDVQEHIGLWHVFHLLAGASRLADRMVIDLAGRIRVAAGQQPACPPDRTVSLRSAAGC